MLFWSYLGRVRNTHHLEDRIAHLVRVTHPTEENIFYISLIPLAKPNFL